MISIESIVDVINENKNAKGFLIYPFGTWGQITKNVLNKYMGIQETAIFDNGLAGKESGVLSTYELSNYSEEYVLLLASDNEDVWSEIREEVKKYPVKVCDLASYFKSSFSFLNEKNIIEECSQTQLNDVFSYTQSQWQLLGKEKPFWSVITEDKYKNEVLTQETLEEFYQSGKNPAKEVARSMKRCFDYSLEDIRKKTCIEVGCGCGRVTSSLADLFAEVVAIDISEGNIAMAKKYVGKENIEYRVIKEIDDYSKLPGADLIYSVIVFQHNCPPVNKYILDILFSKLNPSGVFMFQIPTYRAGYSWKYEGFSDAGKELDMHVLPQKTIFEIAEKNNCVPIEVYEYNCTGNNDYSCMFIFQKNRNGF